MVVRYSYDSWGKPISMPTSDAGSLYSTLGVRNPFRYRGYYYDVETSLYYVKSRYYEPEMGRFINIDDIDYLGMDENLLHCNLFSYCQNNPTNCFDDNGNWSIPNWVKVTTGVVAIAGLAVATACTGGVAAVVCGAALSGAIAGGTSGAASAGLNIVTGTTTVVGNAHGSILHKLATNMEAGKMTASGKYSQIGLNKALKTMGLNGTKRPDVIYDINQPRFHWKDCYMGQTFVLIEEMRNVDSKKNKTLL